MLLSHLFLLSVLEDISRLLCTDAYSDAIIEAAKGLLSDEQTSKRRKILSDLLLNLEDRSELETRDEDADWFQGGISRWLGPKKGLEYPPPDPLQKPNQFHFKFLINLRLCRSICATVVMLKYSILFD